MIQEIINLDTEIFLFINSIHNSYWDVVMKMITGRVVWGVFYISIIYAIYRTFGWKTAIVMWLMSILCVLLADQITASLLRPYFERPRPTNPVSPIYDLVHTVNNYRPGRFGFPSSHAANTFAVATLLSLIFWRLRFTIFIFLWAILVCYSRIYLGVHYPGDLLVGAGIGMFIGMVCYILGRVLTKAWRGDLTPRHRAFTMVSAWDGNHFKFHPVDVAVFFGSVTLFFILVDSISLY